jgi:hypothetical protein
VSRGISPSHVEKPGFSRPCATWAARTRIPGSSKFISPVDPAARWTASWGGPAVYAYCTNYLVDVQHAVIVDVEASTAARQAEVTAARRMIERARDRLDLWPERLIADTGYGSGRDAELPPQWDHPRRGACST